MSGFEAELRLCFLEEAAEMVSSAEATLLSLEKGEGQETCLNELFRVAHNLKGSSQAVGFDSLSKCAHRIEGLLLPLRDKKLTLNALSMNLLFRCVDRLAACLVELRANFDFAVDSDDLLEEINRCLEGGTEPAGDEPLEAVQAPGATAVRKGGDAGSPPAKDPSSQRESIRVALPKVEELLNDVGELVILQTVLSQNRCSFESLFLRKTILQMEKIIRNIQSNSMSLRMVPLKPLAQKLDRIVRDTARSLDKEIEFEVEGEEQELDKTMLERISDPLVHIVRNSVDHGIETKEARETAGKSGSAKVRLVAQQRAGQMVIEVSDDGRGLDLARIRQKAIEVGLVSMNQNLSEDETRMLIFKPGFSTKSEVTALSGRGVGMDVVMTNIEALQGRVEVDSETGRGTTVRLVLPVTLAIIDGVIIEAEGESFVIPLSQIIEYRRLDPANVGTVAGKGEQVRIREEAVPLLSLKSFLRTSGSRREPARGRAAPKAKTVVVVQTSRNGKVGVLVDKLCRQQQVVIKKLSGDLQGTSGIMGGAVLGDGRAALILDLREWCDQSLVKKDFNDRKETA